VSAPVKVPEVLPNAPSLQGPVVPEQTASATMTLVDCKALALRNQPAIAAARVSLAAANARAQALLCLHIPIEKYLAKELPARRQQASIGVTIAEADVRLAELNTIYGIQFCYLSYLYAREQERVADNALKSIKELREIVVEAVKSGGRRDLRELDVDKLDMYKFVAQGRRVETQEGARRALSALREAIAVGPTHAIRLDRDRLLLAQVTPNKDAIIQLALSRRPELAQASAGVEVHALESAAQCAKRLHPTMPTFASGSDLHSRVLPAGSYDIDYKPGPVGPEMPATLAGSRGDRVGQADIYTKRAGIVLTKTRNLIALEAEQAFLRWAEATKKLEEYENAHGKSLVVFNGLKNRFVPTNTKVTLDELLNAAIIASQLRVQVNETRFAQLRALAELERVTAAGFLAGLETAPPAPDLGEKKANEKDDKKDKPKKGNGQDF
jgi:outer membrane protein TolC